LNRVAHHPEASEEFAEAVEYYVEHAPPDTPVRFNSAIEAKALLKSRKARSVFRDGKILVPANMLFPAFPT
jgi:hypothetical protein